MQKRLIGQFGETKFGFLPGRTVLYVSCRLTVSISTLQNKCAFATFLIRALRAGSSLGVEDVGLPRVGLEREREKRNCTNVCGAGRGDSPSSVSCQWRGAGDADCMEQCGIIVTN